MALKTKSETKRTLEEGYFHTGNSGVTIKMEEHESKYTCEGDDNVRTYLNYRFSLSHAAFGSSTNVNFPLGSEQMVLYLIEALTRVRQHMLDNDFKGEYAFEHSDTAQTCPSIINGLTRELLTKTTVTGKHSDETKTIGFVWKDEDGNVVRTDYLSADEAKAFPVYGSGCDSGGEDEGND
jgi:hypothetical protein